MRTYFSNENLNFFKINFFLKFFDEKNRFFIFQKSAILDDFLEILLKIYFVKLQYNEVKYFFEKYKFKTIKK